MAPRGYLGIHAEVPTAQCLCSAIVVNGAPQIKIKIKIKIKSEAAWQPVWFSRPYTRLICGSKSLLARRPGSRPISPAVPDLIVGASLLAIAVCQSIFELNDELQSRASSLPQEKFPQEKRGLTKSQVGC